MRRSIFALALLLVFATVATGVRLHASTECERWIAEYRNALENSPTVQKANAARHRLHHYVHRKVVALTTSKPKPKARVLPARFMRPKMTREEALHKMELACGEIGLDDPVLGNLPADPAPAFIADRGAEDETPGLGALPARNSLVSQNNPTSYPVSGIPSLPTGPGGGGSVVPPGNPGNGGGPPPPPPPPPPAVTPEPGSFVLLATGALGAAGMLRRRFARN
ncbi:PEP-CTERM sorting domain-containing protein [Edaphobacter flagellatus]|uniref:PEP-CTERM sorting domain-containing protein n=1 Tax=Edaphobacter flagellatus TaxID=1933044 RepID=UPI0021B37F74|nr:PEP-CTERM sorting domain-containing protein [Edaphobacter flagellatus]